MKLARFSEGGRTRLGVVVDDGIVDLSRAEPELPTEMLAFLEAGEAAWDRARAAADRPAEADIPVGGDGFRPCHEVIVVAGAVIAVSVETAFAAVEVTQIQLPVAAAGLIANTQIRIIGEAKIKMLIILD